MSDHSEIVVRAQGLTKKYDGFTAVDHIDFDIRKGQCFGFLGPNGAGKTTMMRMIYLSCAVTEGELRVFGEPVTGLKDPYRLKNLFGVVPQEDDLDEELTAEETLLIFCRFYGFFGGPAKTLTEKLLRDVGLSHKAKSMVNHLSGGMRRRLQIARAMIGKPRLLILDEPTTGLDPHMRNELWNHLKQLKQQGVTLILTTHYMNEAEQLCDDLVIMDIGKIIARGHPRHLIQQHVPPSVVEVLFGNGFDTQSLVSDTVRDSVKDTSDLADRRLFYTTHGEALIHALMKDHPQISVHQRPATLDDVFLKITGKSLDV